MDTSSNGQPPSADSKQPQPASEFIRQYLLSTADRLALPSTRPAQIIEFLDISQNSQKEFTVPIDQPLFKPQPSEVVLQNYTPFQTYEILISFRNIDRFGRRIKLEPIKNAVFTLKGWKSDSLCSEKVATGMEVPFILKFTPQEDKDYSYNLVCVTEREKFIVPIHALGSRAILDFPDQVNFDDVPVRHKSSKTLWVRNLGNRVAKYTIDVCAPFRVSPQNGYLAARESMQVDITFDPSKVGSYTGNLIVKYDTGEEMFVRLNGTADDINIRLEKDRLRFDSTFITMTSSKVIKIVNKSDIMAKFKWKSFATETEERMQKERHCLELENQEVVERDALLASQENQPDTGALTLISRKYENIRASIQQNQLLFHDSVFKVDPIEGCVWPNSEVEVTCLFHPMAAGAYQKTMFCEISGRESRLPLTLKGEAKGPFARFSYDLLDIEEVFINTNHLYEVVIENMGDIDLRYNLMQPNSIFGPKFKFHPSTGILPVGQQHTIQIEFLSDTLGEFSDEFQWEIEGALEPLTLVFRGKVVGPTFQFDQSQVDFRIMPYGFTYTQEVSLINTSQIPMTFSVRPAHDHVIADGELIVTPATAELEPYGRIPLKLEFTPKNVKIYNTSLVVDVLNVADSLLHLPFIAESIVPPISLNLNALNFGTCFLNYPYTKTITLRNNSDFPARYQVVEQDEMAKAIYVYDTKKESGIINARSSHDIDVTVRVGRIGDTNFPIFIKILGNEDYPLAVDVKAIGTGPNIVLSTHEINFGSIEVLKSYPVQLTVKNDSLIPANVCYSMNTAMNIFQLDKYEEKIKPGESSKLTITAFLNDSLKFTDTIRVDVETAGIYDVKINAKGLGSTIQFSDDMASIDFGTVFSNRENFKDFVITNRGRRSQIVVLTNDQPRRADNLPTNCFRFEPNRIKLGPGERGKVRLLALTDKAKSASETLFCYTYIDKDPTKKLLFKTLVSAKFIGPVLSVYPPKLELTSLNLSGNDVVQPRDQLTITNSTGLPVHFSLNCPEPFFLDSEYKSVLLAAGENKTVFVKLDPTLLGDRLSRNENATIKISYDEHPQKDTVELVGKVIYPNLKLSTESVNFGHVSTGMQKHHVFQMTNCGTVPVRYNWNFFSGDSLKLDLSEIDNEDGLYGVDKFFDIVPMRGYLEPGETDQVSVIFYAHGNGQFEATAQCNVQGGPPYALPISANVAKVEYHLDRTELNFGQVKYQDIVEKTVTIQNMGDVALNYDVSLPPKNSMKHRLSIFPSCGTIPTRSKQLVTFRYCPCTPESIDENVFIQVAYFRPVPIKITGQGVAPQFKLNIPRQKHTDPPKTASTTDKHDKLHPSTAEEEKVELSLLKNLNMRYLDSVFDEYDTKLASHVKAKHTGSPILFHKAQSIPSKDKKRIINLAELGKIRTYHYVCDFGNVVKGTNRHRLVKITNTGSIPFNLTILRSFLANSGFTVSSEKSMKGSGSVGINESTDLEVNFDSRECGKENLVEAEMPVEIHNGSTIIVHFKANVMLPELKLSSSFVDFGTVIVGHRKIVTVLLQNISAVSCDWNFGPNNRSGSSNTTMSKHFEILPKSGTIEPGSYESVQVRFTPLDDLDYDCTYPLRISMNSKSLVLRVRGLGQKVKLEFDQTEVTMDSILPCSSSCAKKIAVTNLMDFPVEFCSFEFDTQLMEEEEVLKQVANDQNLVFISPRKPGEELSPNLIELALSKIKKEGAIADDEREESFENPSGESVKKNIESGVGDLETKATTPQKEVAPNCFIVHGPPLSGKTTQAHKIAADYDCVYLTLDDIFQPALKRRATVNRDTAVTSISSAVKSSKEKQKNQENATAEVNANSSLISDDIAAEALKERLLRNDCQTKGFVLDGLESQFFSDWGAIVKSVLRNLGDKRKCFFYLLSLDATKIYQRELNMINEQRSQQEAELAFIEQITEDEYDNLPEYQKREYEQRLQLFKKRISEQMKQRRSPVVPTEDLSVKNQEKKALPVEEEKAKKKETAKQMRKLQKADQNNNAFVSKNDIHTSKASIDSSSAGPKTSRRSDRHEDDFGSDIDEFVNMSPALQERYDSFVLLIDSLRFLLREGDKGSSRTNSQIGREKNIKTKVAQQPHLSPADGTIPGSALIPDGEFKPFEDGAQVLYHDLNAAVEEEAVFKQISFYSPIQISESTADDKLSKIPEPVTEQIVQTDFESRDEDSKIFYISKTANADQQQPGEEEVINPEPAKAPSILNRNDNRKNSRAQGHSNQKHEEVEDEPVKETNPFRWVLAPKEKKEITFKFRSKSIGSFERQLHFVLLGAKGKFSINFRGDCRYAEIINEPKKIFSKCRKVPVQDEIVSGEYNLTKKQYEFGPLLCGKPRDRSNVENFTTLNIINPTSFEVKASFGLRQDARGDTFIVDPPQLEIPPMQSLSATIYAFPKTEGKFEDQLICCIKDNPEPYVFNVSCVGVKPELELDKKQIMFDKLIVGKKDIKELCLKNCTLLSVPWKLLGAEGLGDEFNIDVLEGSVAPLSETKICISFCGARAGIVKKTLKLDIFESEKASTITQTETILVSAEAYDVAVDLHFPRGVDGGIDFGTVRVAEEAKQLCTLKNKGKYEVGYRFTFDTPALSEFISIQPQQGVMAPSDKPFAVQLVFQASREIQLKENTSLKCHLVDPVSNEPIGCIPVKISGKTSYSKFSLFPAKELTFGASSFGARITKTIVIENNGELDFKFAIAKTEQQRTSSGRKIESARSRSKDESSASKLSASSSNQKKDLSKQSESIVAGPFALSPASGVIQSGSKQTINVEFHADRQGAYEEFFAVDISDHSPTDFTESLEYRITAESCMAGINTHDFVSIFEEHTVMKRSDLFYTMTNAYAEEERVFYFGAYLTGQTSQARFKISNPTKISCDVVIVTKPRNRVAKSEAPDFAFEVEPKKLNLPPHEHRYVTVTFSPTSIQSYAGIFEAIVENTTDNPYRMLSFELRGEGTLPRVLVEKPSIIGKNSGPLLRFKKSFVGVSQMLPIVIKNDGIIPAKVQLEWVKKVSDIDLHQPEAFYTLEPREMKTIEVKFKAASLRKYEAELKVRVVDNSFEDTVIEIVAESFKEDITVDNLPNDADNEINFRDCLMHVMKSHTFSLTNHTKDVVKFSWTDFGDFQIRPASGYLRPNEKRELSASVQPLKPVENMAAKAICRLSKIRLVSTSNFDAERWLLSESKRNDYEPPHDVLANLPEQVLSLSACADYSSFECDQQDIRFKNTLMYQSRVFKFPIRNIGKVRLPLKLLFLNDHGQLVTEEDSLPFSVSPTNATIEPGESLLVTTRFAPTEVDNSSFILLASMENLPHGVKPPVFRVTGTSLRPFCHFELPESDYISNRRNPDTSSSVGPLEPNTRVIEFNSVGIKVRNTKRFYILNPTNIAYQFEWSCDVDNGHQAFRCLNSKGVIQAGKKFEIVFDYTPETTDLVESLWRFSIPEHKISVAFLLVGTAEEPNVYVDRANLNFKAVLVGRHMKEIVRLVNAEKTPFAFSLVESLSKVTREKSAVQFSPASGTVGPGGEMPIEITFSPTTEKSYNFNLLCQIKKKSNPVIVNIKGEGYEIRETIQSEMADGTLFDLASGASVENIFDFGLVQINDKRIKRIFMTNSGRYNFDFSWKFLNKGGASLSISPEFGTVAKGEKLICELTYLPLTPTPLKNVKLVCQVLNSRTYPITVLGGGCRPLLNFSELEYDFGPCFQHRPGVAPTERTIKVTNDDQRQISFDILQSQNSPFELVQGNNNLAPGESTEIKIYFYARDLRKYEEIVPIEINGLSKVNLKLKGEGAEFKVEMLNQDVRVVNFGAVRVQHVVTRSIKLINRSIIPATFKLGPPAVLENLAINAVSLSSTSEMTLRPKGTANVEIKFSPQCRIPVFHEDLYIEGPGIVRPLVGISGACQGIEVKLETDTIAFGAVVHRSSATRRILLHNRGDVGVKFKWNESQLVPDFFISPTEGYVSPGMDISLEITFHPRQIKSDIRYDNILCEIEGSIPLKLTLTGACITQPPQNEVVRFNVAVRQSETRSVSLSNKSFSVWRIRPMIDNEYWSGAEFIDIEPGQNRVYEITYTPLEMTADGTRHEGSLFFPLPDGTGVLYKLVGTADKPQVEGTITKDISCKTAHAEIIQVKNWLKRPQRFRVIIEQQKPDVSVILRAHDFIDVPGLMSRDFKLNFYAYKEGVTNAKVIFKNDQTQEYMFYNVNFRTTPPGISGTLELSTSVRKLITREISITNPFNVATTLIANCAHPEITVPHNVVIPPKSDGTCLVEFLPLQAKETTARLTLTGSELGTYQYDLKLLASPPGPERSIHFKVPLGATQTQTFRFISFSKVKTEYTCRIESPDFFVEKTLLTPAALQGGSEVCIDVTYEPSKLGDVRTTLFVSSPLGGDYLCPLVGHCIAPRPQGPFLIRTNGTVSTPAGPGAGVQATAVTVSFKNVFSVASTFTMTVDNPAFTVKNSETVPPKKSVGVVVTYKPPLNNAKHSKSCKLVVSHPSGVSWVYYVKAN